LAPDVSFAAAVVRGVSGRRSYVAMNEVLSLSDQSINDFFQGRSVSKRLFNAISREVDQLGDATVRVSKSQIAFRRKRNFALVWIPGQYLKSPFTAPLVLTLSFSHPDSSSRWKEVTAVGPKRFTHHLELYRENEIDEQVRRWLRNAWESAV